jgi:hypothetical protein
MQAEAESHDWWAGSQCASPRIAIISARPQARKCDVRRLLSLSSHRRLARPVRCTGGRAADRRLCTVLRVRSLCRRVESFTAPGLLVGGLPPSEAPAGLSDWEPCGYAAAECPVVEGVLPGLHAHPTSLMSLIDGKGRPLLPLSCSSCSPPWTRGRLRRGRSPRLT